MPIQLKLDAQSEAVLNKISSAGESMIWDTFMWHNTSEEVAEAAVEYMKPLMKVRPEGTGQAEDNLRYVRTFDGTGFTIDFYSLFYANFVDQGSPFNKLYADSYGLKAFPADRRLGKTFFPRIISGVGQGNSPYASLLPAHFTDKTVEYLADGKAEEIMFNNMTDWIDWTVTG